jgi:hypothetical protein
LYLVFCEHFREFGLSVAFFSGKEKKKVDAVADFTFFLSGSIVF